MACFGAIKCIGGQSSDSIVGIIVIGRSCSCIVIIIVVVVVFVVIIVRITFIITIITIIIISSSGGNIVITNTTNATRSPSPCELCSIMSCDTSASTVEL